MIPEGFAASWEAGWNSHDLDRIMAHYDDGIVFRSQKAVDTIGVGVVEGADVLRDYWTRALTRQPDVRFKVSDVFYGHEMIVITYTNHVGRLAAETLRFNDHGLVVEASACHSTEGAWT